MTTSDPRENGAAHEKTSGMAITASRWKLAETQDALQPVGRRRDVSVPSLTLLCHPDMSRIGEISSLPELTRGAQVQVSRLEPLFSALCGGAGRPLADPRISRRPVLLERTANGEIQVDASMTSTQIFVDGVHVTNRMTLTPSTLQRGVALQLGGYFAVLLRADTVRSSPHPHFELVGENPRIQKLRGDVVRVADIEVPVLIRGESGTGKELLAHAIHRASPRRKGPFIAVNMGAVAPSTAASELFGHVRGAFTGASRDHDGLFVRANGGTLFLDEVGETPPELQAMLLRVLETGEVRPLGASRSRKVSVRLVAATDADLEAKTGQGDFKLPLLHRLAGYELRVPALHERRDDIARLFVHFLRLELEAVGEQRRLAGEGAAAFVPADLMCRLCSYAWPGNVRQLRNIVRQLVISSRGSESLVVDTSVRELLNEASYEDTAPAAQSELGPQSVRKKPSELTEGELLKALQRHDFRLGAVATSLGISRTTLYGLIDRSSRIRTAKELTKEEIVAALESAERDVRAAAQALEVSLRGLKLRMAQLHIEG